jgi:hypothetical protein
MILFFYLLFLFAIAHASCIGSGVFSTHILRIFCVVIICASCIINGVNVLVQLSHVPSVIVACASRMLCVACLGHILCMPNATIVVHALPMLLFLFTYYHSWWCCFLVSFVIVHVPHIGSGVFAT